MFPSTHAYLVILLICLFPAPGQTACPPETPELTPEILQSGMGNSHDHGFLWRISKNGNVSYLYGTLHVAKLDWMFPGPRVQQAMEGADTVALELDVMDAGIQSRLARGMENQKSSALPAALQARLRKQADALCIAYDTIAKYTPEMQAATLSIMVGRWDGLYSEFAIDSILAVSGHAANKNMVSLETPEIQLRSLTGATPEAGVHMVEDTLDDIESGRSRTMTNRLANDWATSNFTEFDHFSDWCECLNTDSEREMMKQLLDKRNPNLADKIDNLVSSGKHVFAAVGALHLFGPQGLPTLLAERGYQVERVAFN